MSASDKKVDCRCPGCKKQYRRVIDQKEPPPRKGDVDPVFREECRSGTLYPTERSQTPSDE